MTAPSLFGDSGTEPEAVASTDLSAAGVGRTDRYAETASLYRKYRPSSFSAEELVGQEHVVRTLRNAIALDRVAHAYLFSGPRGTGKTTTARLLAKAVNCLHDDPRQRPCNVCVNCQAINAGAAPDIVEIDAASNRGIDDIRDLRERVRYAPAQLPSKVYIIDEAHQITGAAANAFLKTLEEPPVHTRFILATTDPEELLPTIVSRCQRFEFRRVGVDDIARRLRTVAEIERIAVDEEALRLIARHATGSLRDALGLLEQLMLHADTNDGAPAPATIDAAQVRQALGLSHNDRVEQLVEAIGRRDAGSALHTVQDAIDGGEDARQLNRQLLSYLRQLLIERAGGASPGDERMRSVAAGFSLDELALLARRFGEIDFTIKHAPYPQLPLEVALVQAAAAATPDRVEPAIRAAPEPAESGPSRPTSLRDRVRGTTSVRDVSPTDGALAARPEPAAITPLRPDPPPVAVTPPSAGTTGDFDVDRIAELWPNVRADVKAVNRRVEALLSEVDPVAISGSQITLAVPYPFHRDKLNSDDVRETVSAVLSRLLGQDISIVCVLRGEISAPAKTASAPSPAPTATDEPEQPATEDGERAEIRLRAARNIFDAEEIDALPAASQPSANGSG